MTRQRELPHGPQASEAFLRESEKVIVSFVGDIDSSWRAKATVYVTNERIVLVTVRHFFWLTDQRELEYPRALCLGCRLRRSLMSKDYLVMLSLGMPIVIKRDVEPQIRLADSLAGIESPSEIARPRPLDAAARFLRLK